MTKPARLFELFSMEAIEKSYRPVSKPIITFRVEGRAWENGGKPSSNFTGPPPCEAQFIFSYSLPVLFRLFGYFYHRSLSFPQISQIAEEGKIFVKSW